MSTHDQVTMAALENQAFALMGRLHVILRRESGRITDIEYMRSDPIYCQHILKVASQSHNPDLQQILDRLNLIFFGEAGVFKRQLAKPLLSRSEPAPKPMLIRSQTAQPMATPVTLSHADQADRSYVGRLR